MIIFFNVYFLPISPIYIWQMWVAIFGFHEHFHIFLSWSISSFEDKKKVLKSSSLADWRSQGNYQMKKRIYRISLNHHTSYNNIILYRNERNKLNSLLKMEEKNIYSLRFWQRTLIFKIQVIKSKYANFSSEFSHNVSTLNSKEYIASTFNDYCINIGPILVSKIPQLGINLKKFMPFQNNMFFLALLKSQT